VFGCKCFILNKRPRTSKFAPKVDEGFFLGYGPNEHAYRVFNLTTGRIEVTVDLTFDESNGSQVEQVDLNVVGNDKPSCEAIKQLAIGDVRPVEAQEEDENQVQTSTPLEGPEVTGSGAVQTSEVPKIPRRFQELALKLNLREIFWRFQGLEVQHHKTP
jgi:hypothetical protein